MCLRSTRMTTVNDQALNSLVNILKLETELAEISNQKLSRSSGAKQKMLNRLHEERRYKNFVGLFVAYCRLARELGELISIFEHSELALQTLSAVFSRLSSLFIVEIASLSADLIASWDSSCLAIQAPKQDSCVPLPLLIVAQSRRDTWLNRQEQLKTLQIPMILRRHAMMIDHYSTMDLNEEEVSEIERSESELSDVFDIDEACMLIQTFERVRQALLRRLYLKDVRQKAMDLDKQASAIDINRAAIIIQSRTRGYLTRKRVRYERQKELELLGMQLETVLSFPTISQDNNIPSTASTSESGNTTKTSVIVDILSAFYAELSTNKRQTINKNTGLVDEASRINKNERSARIAFEELVMLGVIKQQPSDPNLMYTLVSYPVETIWNTSKAAKVIDLRNALLCTTVVPQALSAASDECGKTKSILLIGRPKSGKSAWSQAIAASCAATYIRVTLNLLKKPPTVRNKIVSIITQFARDERNAVVVFDRLEIFAVSEEKKQKRFKPAILSSFRKLFAAIVELKESGSVILVGMSRKEDLDSHFNQFDIRMTLKAPETPEQFELIVSRLKTRLGQNKLNKVPNRVSEISKATRKAKTCGEVLETVDAKVMKVL